MTIKTPTPEIAIKRRGKPMWLSFERASTIHDVANMILIGDLVVGVVATWLVVTMGKIKEDHLRGDIDSVNERAANANERAAKADNAAAEAKKELEKERIRRLELEGRVAWRRLTEEQQLGISERLKQFAGLEVHIIFSSGDMEGKSFANDILSTLRKAKWFVPYKPGALLDMSAFGAKYGGEEKIDTGVSIVSSKEDIGRKAAEAFVHELTLLGYDAVNKGPHITEKEAPARPMVEVRVYTRPEAAQGYMKLMQKK
jgi:hypothetical protein